MLDLSAEKRRRAILERIQNEGSVKVQSLCEQFDVSEVTIRRDLDILESENLIRRVRGGAVLETSAVMETIFSEKLSLHQEAKKAIAKRAASLVQDGQVVMLSAGSTTTFIARELIQKRELTIVTTAINIASELAGLEHITLIVIGGIVRPGSYAMVGSMAENTLHLLNADIAFVGVDGVDIRTGFTTPNIMEAHTDSVMLQRANRKVIVADDSKFGKTALSQVADIKDINTLITNSTENKEYIEMLEKMGLEVLLG